MKFVEIAADDFDKWIKQLGRSNHLQSLDMARLKAARGREIHYLALADDQDQILEACILANLPTHVGGAFELEGWLPGDLSNRDQIITFLNGVKDFVKSHKGISLLVKPDVGIIVTDEKAQNPKKINEDLVSWIQAAGFTYHYQDKRPEFAGFDWNYKKDLTTVDPNKVEKSYLHGAQQSLKQAHKYSTVVREITGIEEMPRFYACYEETCQRLGIAPKEYPYFEEVYQNIGSAARFVIAEINFKDYQASLIERQEELEGILADLDEDLAKNPNSRKKNNQRREYQSQYDAQVKKIADAQVWVDQAKEEQTVLAVALFIESPYEMTYLYSGSDEEYSIINAPYLIQDQSIKLAIDHDIPVYNFLGISEPFDENNGLLHFKQSFNGYAERNIGTFTWSPHPHFLALYEKVKRLLGRYN
ncbi:MULTISPECIES: peptidoglycan bridge formation glycyltransferase FemA/FemB family protein [Aerococcus]|uniref:peptidoglycan bridge formation glycyltransferase FemA/FemB family protein n=1 Tax=Aerococcus TaxID=1375 RepID=UPI0018A7AEE1|nr:MULTISPECIES: peptidoglycan bridge formation glycyltransferase FemA/FemB family protein [Aerococcus]MCY3035252.1 aminoacyltransferase [Aerococcus sp. Group 2]MCY3038675.1 aminoacyltransferase [Aerococcus sp. Group 2]MCY3040830.1 aminoacyltransferase [Aerococcus sp. Group 2]MCY3042067.1 aminoacyltransferase [Aerococcus sp. Group 2]MDK6521063.1 peptidoglycan bridge formation glycyltransferase FemA/FemB family protein [Aerococcus urinae]